MLLADLVATSTEVAATRSRKAKAAAFAELLALSPTPSAEEIETVTSYLAGSLRQRRTGLGWRSMQSLPAPAAEPSLTVLRGARGLRADRGAGRHRVAGGPRRGDAPSCSARATADEQRWLRGLVTGEVPPGRARLAGPGGAGRGGRRSRSPPSAAPR